MKRGQLLAPVRAPQRSPVEVACVFREANQRPLFVSREANQANLIKAWVHVCQHCAQTDAQDALERAPAPEDPCGEQGEANAGQTEHARLTH